MSSLIQSLNTIFFRGLLTILPIGLTIYVVYSIVSLMEGLMGNALRPLLGSEHYHTGFGFFGAFLVIFFFGLVLNNFVLRTVLARIETELNKIPFVKAIYAPLKDLMNLFSKNASSPMKSVVLIHMANNVRILGVITRDDFSDMPKSLQAQKLVAVYCPWSYGLGGFTLIVTRDQVEEIDMPIETAMRLAITGWVKAPQTNSDTGL